VIGALPIIGDLIGLAGDWLKGKREIKAAIIKRQAELIRSKTENDAAWELAQINAKDRWLRRGCFLLFALPFAWAAFDPAGVHEYFTVALGAIPRWYQVAFLSMVGGIWGVATLKGILNK